MPSYVVSTLSREGRKFKPEVNKNAYNIERTLN